MDISFFHRLTGAWLGYHAAIAHHPTLAKTTAIAPQLWQCFCEQKEWEAVLMTDRVWSDNPLETALSLLPMLLFYHEDVADLGDRLQPLDLPTDQLAIIKALGHFLGASLVGAIQPDRILAWLEGRSPDIPKEIALLQASYRKGLSWRGLNQGLIQASPEISRESVQLYGALVWSYGNIHQCQQLLAQCAPIVQAWGFVLMGALRGDRQHRNLSPSRLEYGRIQQEVLKFWSCWSGLPLENQLKLEQIPVIAAATSLKSRSSLKLISQRHHHSYS